MAKGSGSPNGGVNQGKSSSGSTSSSKSSSASATASKGTTSESKSSKSAPSNSSKSASTSSSSKTASKTADGLGGLLSGLLGAFGIKTDSAPAKTGLSVSGPATKGAVNPGKLTGNAAVVAREMAKAGFPKAAIASAIGRLSIESYGRLDPKARNKGDAKDGTDSIGIAQWNQGRLAGLKDFAAKQGLAFDTIDAQAKYFVHELTTTEKAAGDRLRAATDTKAGAKAMLDFERPKSRDPSKTIAAADKVLGLLGDGTASSNPPQAGPYGYMFGMADPAPNTGKATVTSIDKAQPKQAGVFETALKFATDPVGTAFDMIGKMDFANAKGTSEPGMAANPGGSNEKPSMFQGVDNAIQVATPIVPTTTNATNPLLLPSGRKPFDWSKIKVL